VVAIGTVNMSIRLGRRHLRAIDADIGGRVNQRCPKSFTTEITETTEVDGSVLLRGLCDLCSE